MRPHGTRFTSSSDPALCSLGFDCERQVHPVVQSRFDRIRDCSPGAGVAVGSDPLFGSRMPLLESNQLPDEALDIIRAWIGQGAPGSRRWVHGLTR